MANSTNPCWILQNFRPNQDFMVDLVTCKNEEDPIKIEGDKIFPIITLLELSVAMETGGLNQSGPKPYAINPPPK